MTQVPSQQVPLPEAMRAFAGVGAIGFVVDAGVFQLIHSTTGWLFWSRILATSLAIFLTWRLHRRYVFKTQGNANALTELCRYLAVQSGGVLTNLAVYFVLLWAVPALRDIPIIAVAIGAGFAMIVNFTGARNWAFVASAQDSTGEKHD